MIQPRRKRVFGLFIICGLIGISINMVIFVIPTQYSIALEKPLRDEATIPIGAAVDYQNLYSNDQYKSLVSGQYNSLTPENAMKMGSLRPTNTSFYWDQADYIVNYAENIGVRVHGHCLVWHEQTPRWLDSYNGTQEDWEQLLKTHIQTVVSRYAGRIASWDVVNEAFNSDGYRNTIWYQKIGPDYIKKAFIWAHEADPNAKLYYNDFGLQDLSKLTIILKFINSCLTEGVPIHGIGDQAHLNVHSVDMTAIRNEIVLINNMHVDFRISEFDLSLNKGHLYRNFTAYLANLQKQKYYEITTAYLQAKRLTGITFWGTDDGHSWIPWFTDQPDWPLLFDNRYQPKPAAQGFIQALHTK